MSDKIIISDLKVDAYIGCSAEERKQPQQLSASVRIKTDLRRAARTGELSDTVCYLTVCKDIERIATRSDWQLLEQLGETVAQELLEQHPAIESLEILLKKFVIPQAAWVGIEFKRSRK